MFTSLLELYSISTLNKEPLTFLKFDLTQFEDKAPSMNCTVQHWTLPYLSSFPQNKHTFKALLGGLSPLLQHFTPCSLLFFTSRSFLAIFFAPFSFLIAHCSLLNFLLAPWWSILPAPFCKFLCFMLTEYHFHDPCSFCYFRLPTPLAFIGHYTCTLITPNGVHFQSALLAKTSCVFHFDGVTLPFLFLDFYIINLPSLIGT